MIAQIIHAIPRQICSKGGILPDERIRRITIFQYKESVCLLMSLVLTKERNNLIELTVPLFKWKCHSIGVELLHIKWNSVLAVNRS